MSSAHNDNGASLRATVIRGGASLAARQFASMLLSVLGIFIITRLVGPGSYGAYAAALGIYQFIQTLGLMGIPVYLIREAKEVSRANDQIASTLLVAIALLAVLIIESTADGLASWIDIPAVAKLLRFLVILLPLDFLGAVASARLDRALNFRRIAMIEFTAQITYYLVALPLAAAGYGAWALAIAWGTQHLFFVASLHVAAKHRPSFSWDRSVARRMTSYGIKYSIATWSWQLRLLVNPLIIGPLLGVDSVGYVGLTIRLMELLAIVKTITWRLSIAAFARIQRDRAKLSAAVTEAMQLQTLAIAPVLLGFSWVGFPVLLAIAGSRWMPVMILYPYVAISYLTNAQFNMHAAALTVLGQNFKVAAFGAANLFLLAVGTAVTVHWLGLVGYGFGEVVALPSYILLDRFLRAEIPAPSYRISFIWWLGVVAGLLWRQIGLLAIAAPFIAVLYPGSLRQIREYVRYVLPTQLPGGREP